MSYDFHLFVPQPGVDPLTTVYAERENESTQINPGSPDPSKEFRKRAIADALIGVDPTLAVFPFGYEEIAKFEEISVEAAKLRYRHLELNSPEGGPGIQITLLDDGASLTVPYWHRDAKARTVFAQIWEYLLVVQRVGGYQIYDPQLDCIVDLGLDLEMVTRRYREVVKRIIG